MKTNLFIVTISLCVPALYLDAATRQVGPGQAYAKPCAAIAAAAPGDTILIDAAGSYTGDVCSWTQNSVTLRGVNGRPRIDAGGKNAAGKGIWVIDGNDTIVENIEFSGATVPDGNGAAIRFEGSNLTVRRCYFHNNQDGILTNNGGDQGELLVEFSEFASNGTGNGYTHNIYVGSIPRFTFRYNYSHDAVGGQLVKTRAAVNRIFYNRLTTENGTTSWELDIPNGGLSFVIGNVIQQGPHGSNSNIVSYMVEGATTFNNNHDLYLVNNTLVNDRSNGDFLVTRSTTPAVIRNNIFAGPGSWSATVAPVTANNLLNVDPKFVNRAAYDYHLQPGSPAINAGADPGMGDDTPLAPGYEYVHPACGRARVSVGAIDIGAFEYGNTGAQLACTAPSTAVALAAVAVPSSAKVGTPVTGSVQLAAAAPAGGVTVVLASSNAAAASGPSSVLVPAGAAYAEFTIDAGGVTVATPVTFTASYGGASRTAVLTVNPALAIGGVLSSNVTSTSATIQWTTNVAATSQVKYGVTAAYGSLSALDSNGVTAHSVSLSGLTPATVYHFAAEGVDATGAATQSPDFSFTTTAAVASPAPAVYSLAVHGDGGRRDGRQVDRSRESFRQ